MKMKFNFCYLLAAALAATLVAGCESESEEHESKEHHHHHHHEDHAKLLAEAKVTEADARVTALTKVPDGTIKEAELEKEKGKLIWSFDMAQPNAGGISEVNVDAISGELVAIEFETPKDQAKDKDDDEKNEKKDKD